MADSPIPFRSRSRAAAASGPAVARRPVREGEATEGAVVIVLPLASQAAAPQAAVQPPAPSRTVAGPSARPPARMLGRPADEGVPPHAVPVIRRPASLAPLAGMATVMAGLPMLRSQAALVRQICGDIARDWERAEANLDHAVAGCEAVRDLTARCDAAYRPDGTVDMEAYERLRAEIADGPATSAAAAEVPPRQQPDNTCDA